MTETGHNEIRRKPPVQQDSELDIRRFIFVLWRHSPVTLGLFLIFMSLALIFLSTTENRYTARSLLILEPINYTTPELSELLQNLPIDSSMVLNEIEVIKSRMLIRRVIRKLGLYGNAGAANIRTSEENTKYQGFRSLKMHEYEELPEDILSPEMNAAVDSFLKHLSIRPIPGAFVIQISFTSENKNLASQAVNILTDAYIELRIEKKYMTARKAESWLIQRLADLNNQVRASELAVKEYKEHHQLDKTASGKTTTSQLKDLQQKLADTKIELAEIQSRQKLAREMLEEPDSIERFAGTFETPVIRNLRLTETSATRKLAELSSRYGEKHPQIIDIKSEIEDIHDQIEIEITRIINSLENEHALIQAHIASLENEINELEAFKQEEELILIDLRELEREAMANHLVYEKFLETYKTSSKKEELQDPEARVLSYAPVPKEPDYPNKPLFLALTALFSLFSGVALSLVLEKLDTSIRSSEQLEHLTGYPCLAAVPIAKGRNEKTIANLVIQNPISALAESIKSLRVNLYLRTKSKAKVLAVTSSFSGEGKTTLSAWLGKTAAKSGDKVLIVDCDLRRPKLHRTFDGHSGKTLEDCLSGDSSLEDAVNIDENSGAHILLASKAPHAALDLLGSEKMKNLIKTARNEYDLVILDCPASLAVADTRLIALLADYTLYTTCWHKTSKDAVLTGLKQFLEINYNSIAMVLTNINVKKYTKYGYGDLYGYYSGYNGADS